MVLVYAGRKNMQLIDKLHAILSNQGEMAL
jgi:hypothetical protein